MRLRSLIAASAAALAVLSTPAHAVFINGGISFADGIDNNNNTTWIVSQLNAIGDTASTPESVNGCSGDFANPPNTAICNPVTGLIAFDFTIGPAGQLAYSYNGFSFVLNGFDPVTRIGLTCSQGGCGDSLLFRAFGTVSGNGFDPTGFTMNFTAQGECSQLGTQTACDPSKSVTASWSTSIRATGQPPQLVPEPSGAALIGLGLVAFVLARRRT